MISPLWLPRLSIMTLLAGAIGWHVELLGWEDTLPGASRPQDKINEDVDRCELFLGLLRRRWGEPPGGKWSTGFEEDCHAT
jgi:hypothetical protein